MKHIKKIMIVMVMLCTLRYADASEQNNQLPEEQSTADYNYVEQVSQAEPAVWQTVANPDQITDSTNPFNSIRTITKTSQKIEDGQIITTKKIWTSTKPYYLTWTNAGLAVGALAGSAAAYYGLSGSSAAPVVENNIASPIPVIAPAAISTDVVPAQSVPVVSTNIIEQGDTKMATDTMSLIDKVRYGIAATGGVFSVGAAVYEYNSPEKVMMRQRQREKDAREHQEKMDKIPKTELEKLFDNVNSQSYYFGNDIREEKQLVPSKKITKYIDAIDQAIQKASNVKNDASDKERTEIVKKLLNLKIKYQDDIQDKLLMNRIYKISNDIQGLLNNKSHRYKDIITVNDLQKIKILKNRYKGLQRAKLNSLKKDYPGFRQLTIDFFESLERNNYEWYDSASGGRNLIEGVFKPWEKTLSEIYDILLSESDAIIANSPYDVLHKKISKLTDTQDPIKFSQLKKQSQDIQDEQLTTEKKRLFNDRMKNVSQPSIDAAYRKKFGPQGQSAVSAPVAQVGVSRRVVEPEVAVEPAVSMNSTPSIILKVDDKPKKLKSFALDDSMFGLQLDSKSKLSAGPMKRLSKEV